MVTKCRVEGCSQDATHEVLLYDEYPGGEEFCEQDFTCPFLCLEHQQENEQKARGIREPRGFVRYPYSNKHGAQGYTRYRLLRPTNTYLIGLPSPG